MTPEQYRKVLWQGSGRGVLFARAQKDISAYRDVILDACLHCRVYDFQVDGTRSGYILDVISALPDRAGCESAVIESLAETCDGDDKLHRYGIAAHLAKEGNSRSLSEMYRNFQPAADEGVSVAGQIVQADGLRGFQTVVKSIFDAWPQEMRWFCDDVAEILGDEVVEAALKDSGLMRPVRESGPADAKQEYPPHFAKRATEAELLAAAERMMSAIESSDWKQVSWHLRVFGQRPFPFDLEPLLKIAIADPEAPLRCSQQALNALKHFTHPTVRELGCERRNVDLIAANFQPGDHRMVLGWYRSEQDYDLAHNMESDLIGLWKRHPRPETEADMLLSIYEKGACSICRRSALKRLIELNQLPAQIRTECRWDASEEIRKLVG